MIPVDPTLTSQGLPGFNNNRNVTIQDLVLGFPGNAANLGLDYNFTKFPLNSPDLQRLINTPIGFPGGDSGAAVTNVFAIVTSGGDYDSNLAEGLSLSVDQLSPALRAIHNKLPNKGSIATFNKKEVSLRQLNQIGRLTGDEYTVFTLKSQRTVIRGYGNEITVPNQKFLQDIIEGKLGRYSGHTHPPGYSVTPGPADRPFLTQVGVKRSGIWGLQMGADGKVKSVFKVYSPIVINEDIIKTEENRARWREFYGE